MSLIIPKEQSFYVTSQLKDYEMLSNGSKLGKDGTVVSADGSTVFINLNQGIDIPIGAIECTFQIEQAAIWYTAANISEALGNNKFNYIYTDVAQPEIVIPDGLYAVESLNDFISREFINRGQLENLITLTGDESTQKVVITCSKYTQVDFTVFNSCREVLGWSYQVFPEAMPVVEVSRSGESGAKFNNLQSFTIRSDIITDGLMLNNVKSNLMASIPIPDGAANHQIVFEPNHPSKIDCTNLRGKNINNYYVQICDQNGDSVPQSEPFVILISMHYKVLFTNQDTGILDF
jgi:hypothetical protein